MWIPYSSKIGWARRVGGYITRPIRNQVPHSKKREEMGETYDVVSKMLFSFLFSSFRMKKRPQAPQNAEKSQKTRLDGNKLARQRQAQARVRFRDKD